MDKFYVLNSDNFENQIVTERAYRELRLQMSTGDFHTHTAVRALPALADFYGYLDLIDGEIIVFDLNADLIAHK